MYIIEENTLGSAWIRYIRYVYDQGRSTPDDQGEIIESGPILIEVNNVSKEDPIIAQHADADVINLYIKKMFSCEIIPEFKSTYGDRLFGTQGANQIEWAIQKLKKDQWSKSAAIGLLIPNDTSLKIPCLISLLPIIRNETLILNAVFRSQNVINSYGNFFGLQSIQQLFIDALNVGKGPIRSISLCPHIYSKDLLKAKDLLLNYSKNV